MVDNQQAALYLDFVAKVIRDGHRITMGDGPIERKRTFL